MKSFTRVLILCSLAGLGVLGIRFLLEGASVAPRSTDAEAGPYPAPRRVKTVSLKPAAPRSGLQLHGIVIAPIVEIRVPISAKLASIAVVAGQTVRTDDELARLDSVEANLALERQSARVRSARSAVVEAEAQSRHAEELRVRQETNTDAYSRDDLLNARLQAVTTSARLTSTREQLAAEEREERIQEHRHKLHRITAPGPGIVSEVLRPVGVQVQQGDAVLRIEGFDRELLVKVPEDMSNPNDLKYSLELDGRTFLLELHRVRLSFNADGSRTLLLGVPEDAKLPTGRIVSIQVVPPERLP